MVYDENERISLHNMIEMLLEGGAGVDNDEDIILVGGRNCEKLPCYHGNRMKKYFRLLVKKLLVYFVELL